MTPELVSLQAQLLEEQVRLYRTLNSLAERKERVLIQADVKALDHIINSEQTLILKVAEVEKRRFSAQKELAATWDLPLEKVTLETISLRAGEEIMARCQRAGEELTEILAELKERNQRCQTIIKGALDVIERTLGETGPRPKLMDRLV
ncbi:MAG TPA: flagellar protein FlgN [bacterium]|jgi:flagellar biosynthesis/type III secretory pathway chaperone|nr:flagellar protein FlgN [bacterium]